MDSRPFLVVAVVVLAIGGCAPSTRWAKPDATMSQAKADLTACRRTADREVLGRAPRPYEDDSVIASGPQSGRDNPVAMASRQRDEKAFDRAVSACMTGKGYALGPAK